MAEAPRSPLECEMRCRLGGNEMLALRLGDGSARPHGPLVGVSPAPPEVRTQRVASPLHSLPKVRSRRGPPGASPLRRVSTGHARVPIVVVLMVTLVIVTSFG